MTTSWPLHVRVALALGWTDVDVRDRTHIDRTFYYAFPPDVAMPAAKQEIPRYDTDWAAIGPVIERLRIKLRPAAGGAWAASDGEPGAQESNYPTAHLAVCYYVLGQP